ncbi:MAG TPA: FAD-binding oxidoreductase [Vicinamibacterales bacterium]|nr:FAD-binding oxidoreductase [Vicinamibacterales bacterium]
MSLQLTLPVRESFAATPRARVLRLDLEGRPFAFRAGQAVLIGAHGRHVRKPYSIAVAPGDVRRHGWLELLVQMEEDGGTPGHLGLEPGVRLDVEGPIGTFTLPDRPVERRFIFIAGGTGIAPLRAMLHDALARWPDADLGLLYSARAPDEFAYAAELRDLAAHGRLGLHQTVTRRATSAWTARRGRIDLDILTGLVHDPATLCFVCGPPALVAEMPPLLRQLGVASERIRTEEWG